MTSPVRQVGGPGDPCLSTVASPAATWKRTTGTTTVETVEDEHRQPVLPDR
jgi:hypothetical protein